MSGQRWVPTTTQKRDIAKEQAMVCEMWKLVHANIKIDAAMKCFLLETLDKGGGQIIQLAFDLVRQVLNPKGYVRLDHTRETQSLYQAIRTEGNAWRQQGKKLDTMWDFNDAWLKAMTDWHKTEKYVELLPKTVESFCEEDTIN
jgi:hypothetical protein